MGMRECLGAAPARIRLALPGVAGRSASEERPAPFQGCGTRVAKARSRDVADFQPNRFGCDRRPGPMWESSVRGAGSIDQPATPKASARENIRHALPGVKKSGASALAANRYDRFKALLAGRLWRGRQVGGRCRFCRLHFLAE
jgi:hypothetical protein